MLYPQLGEILPLVDNQQVVWALHQELSGGDGDSSFYESYCDRSAMDNNRVLSLLCGRQLDSSGFIDPDCRRGDYPSGPDEDLSTTGSINWLNFSLLHLSDPHLDSAFSLQQIH